MENGYRIFWTDHALKELRITINYLEENRSDKELRNLVLEIEKTLSLIVSNPFLFPKSDNFEIRRVVILRYNTMYYRINGKTIEVLSFFSNRQNPQGRYFMIR